MIPSEAKSSEKCRSPKTELEYGNGHFDLTRDVLELGKYLADDEFVRVMLCIVAIPVEQGGDEIRYGHVEAENVVEGRVACAALQSRNNLRAGARAEANQP
jgi:hypothetical protein